MFASCTKVRLHHVCILTKVHGTKVVGPTDQPLDLQGSPKVVVKMANLTFDNPSSQAVGPTTLVPWRLLFSIGMLIFIQIAWRQFSHILSPSHTPIMGPSVTSVGQTVVLFTLFLVCYIRIHEKKIECQRRNRG